jgi:hypothetical protein
MQATWLYGTSRMPALSAATAGDSTDEDEHGEGHNAPLP